MNTESKEENIKITGVPSLNMDTEFPEEEIIFEDSEENQEEIQNDHQENKQNQDQQEEVFKTRYGRSTGKPSLYVPTFEGKKHT